MAVKWSPFTHAIVLLRLHGQRVFLVLELLDLVVNALDIAEQRKVLFLFLGVYMHELMAVVHAHLFLQLIECGLELQQTLVDGLDRLLVLNELSISNSSVSTTGKMQPFAVDMIGLPSSPASAGSS